MADNVAPIVDELRRAYTIIAPVFGDKPMPLPVINVPSKDRRRKGNSWYTPDSWQSDSTDVLNLLGGGSSTVASKSEICIAAEALDLPERDLLIELTHQMVHHYNFLAKTKDTACGLDYYKEIKDSKPIEGFAHNFYFRMTCNAIGLFGHKDEEEGVWKLRAGSKLDTILSSVKLDKNVFDLSRNKDQERPGSRLKKFSCPCGVNVRVSAATFLATCERCHFEFVYADKDARDRDVRRLKWLKREVLRNERLGMGYTQKQIDDKWPQEKWVE